MSSAERALNLTTRNQYDGTYQERERVEVCEDMNMSTPVYKILHVCHVFVASPRVQTVERK